MTCIISIPQCGVANMEGVGMSDLIMTCIVSIPQCGVANMEGVGMTE